MSENMVERVKVCEFPGSYVACWKCEPCLAILRKREAAARGHADLISQQSRQECRICKRQERYCQTDGQGRGRHDFAPLMTCESCVHMGRRYWNDEHFCGKSGERRAAAFRSSGDPSQDFMDQFRKFFDASPSQSAETCDFFAPRAALEASDD